MSGGGKREDGMTMLIGSDQPHRVPRGPRLKLTQWEKGWRKFERERERILNRIPSSHRDMFNRIGFLKGSDRTPVLVLSPFDVPPEPTRQEWLDIFNSTRDEDLRDSNIIIVYIYGSSKVASSCYTLLRQNDIILYREKLSRKGLPYVPKDKFPDPSPAIIEMLDDLSKEPHLRRRGVAAFVEYYELMNDVDLVEQNSSDDESYDNKQGDGKDQAKDIAGNDSWPSSSLKVKSESASNAHDTRSTCPLPVVATLHGLTGQCRLTENYEKKIMDATIEADRKRTEDASTVAYTTHSVEESHNRRHDCLITPVADVHPLENAPEIKSETQITSNVYQCAELQKAISASVGDFQHCVDGVTEEISMVAFTRNLKMETIIDDEKKIRLDAEAVKAQNDFVIGHKSLEVSHLEGQQLLQATEVSTALGREGVDRWTERNNVSFKNKKRTMAETDISPSSAPTTKARQAGIVAQPATPQRSLDANSVHGNMKQGVPDKRIGTTESHEQRERKAPLGHGTQPVGSGEGIKKVIKQEVVMADSLPVVEATPILPQNNAKSDNSVFLASSSRSDESNDERPKATFSSKVFCAKDSIAREQESVANEAQDDQLFEASVNASHEEMNSLQHKSQCMTSEQAEKSGASIGTDSAIQSRAQSSCGNERDHSPGENVISPERKQSTDGRYTCIKSAPPWEQERGPTPDETSLSVQGRTPSGLVPAANMGEVYSPAFLGPRPSLSKIITPGQESRLEGDTESDNNILFVMQAHYSQILSSMMSVSAEIRINTTTLLNDRMGDDDQRTLRQVNRILCDNLEKIGSSLQMTGLQIGRYLQEAAGKHHGG